MKKKIIGLIDGQSGNIGSIKKAIKDIIKDKPYQLKIIQSQFDPNQFSKIVLPGQGAYATLISNLKKLKIFNSLKIYLENNFPYLGICVGMQILSDVGYEDKTTKGLGIIHGEIKKFEKKNLIIPHMGWNSLKVNKDNKIVTPAFNEKDFYFVHSYIFEKVKKSDVLATTKYGKNFPSVVNKEIYMEFSFIQKKAIKMDLN